MEQRFQVVGRKGGHPADEIKVRTITLDRLFTEHGVPYYIKCDIEGADELFVRQLLADGRRPNFVSVEAISLEVLALLYAAGYDRVQVVNQALNAVIQPPKPAREGRLTPTTFNGHMSGLFGLELRPEAWVTFARAAHMYLDFLELKRRDDALAHGWLDFHVTTTGVLEQVT